MGRAVTNEFSAMYTVTDWMRMHVVMVIVVMTAKLGWETE